MSFDNDERFVIVRRNDPKYKGCDEYYIGSTGSGKSLWVGSIAEAWHTRFRGTAEAAIQQHKLKGTEGQLEPEVIRVIQETRWREIHGS